MKYIYLKLGRANLQLPYWLQNNDVTNIYRTPSAAIFFGKVTTRECKELMKLEKNVLNRKRKDDKNIPTYRDLHNQIKEFIDAGKNKNARFISISDNKVYLFEPVSEVFDMDSKKRTLYCDDLKKYGIPKDYIEHIKNKDIPKIMHVKIIKKLDKNIPYILRTLNTNQYFNRGTCREIKEEMYWEIIQAIKKVLGEERKITEKLNSLKLFRLLSPHQFETLIFLIFINAGLFSPAWRAGTLPDIDIIGVNYDNPEPIQIGKEPTIRFEKNNEITFQVKRKQTEKAQNADYTITLNPSERDKTNPDLLPLEWLVGVIKEQPQTRQWLEHSLKWVIEDTPIQSIFDLIN